MSEFISDSTGTTLQEAETTQQHVLGNRSSRLWQLCKVLCKLCIFSHRYKAPLEYRQYSHRLFFLKIQSEALGFAVAFPPRKPILAFPAFREPLGLTPPMESVQLSWDNTYISTGTQYIFTDAKRVLLLI